MISCIIPTHARPDYLREAIDSVLAQTTPPDEIIVVSDVDDAESRAVVAELQASVALPLRYVHNCQGSGASSSRNLGAELASQPLLAFLDDDDKWRPGYLEGAIRALERDPADAVATWIMMFRDDKVADGLRIVEGLAAAAAASENPGVTGSNLVVHREAFDAIDGFDEKLLVKNDGDFFFRFLLAGRRYAVNPEPLVLQRKHSSGQLTGRTTFRAVGLEAYMAKHWDHLSISDRRFIRLSAARIRFHAARSRPEKLKQLAIGALNSSPKTLLDSYKNRSSREFWITDGFTTP